MSCNGKLVRMRFSRNGQKHFLWALTHIHLFFGVKKFGDTRHPCEKKWMEQYSFNSEPKLSQI